jgi:hypothetical protein
MQRSGHCCEVLKIEGISDRRVGQEHGGSQPADEQRVRRYGIRLGLLRPSHALQGIELQVSAQGLLLSLSLHVPMRVRLHFLQGGKSGWALNLEDEYLQAHQVIASS